MGFPEILNPNMGACQEDACHVTCKNVANVYASLDEVLEVKHETFNYFHLSHGLSIQ